MVREILIEETFKFLALSNAKQSLKHHPTIIQEFMSQIPLTTSKAN